MSPAQRLGTLSRKVRPRLIQAVWAPLLRPTLHARSYARGVTPMLPSRLTVPGFRVLPFTLLFASACGSNGAELPATTVRATRGSVVRKAIATGIVGPARESEVNTQLGGFVRKLHVALGDKVSAGQALLEVWPLLTQQELLRAERRLQAAIEGEEAAQEFADGKHLLAGMMRVLQGKPNIERMQRAAARGRRNAEESLALLRNGAVESGGRKIDFVVRAPIAGHVLELAEIGDPVTPRSNFGTGTIVAVVGDLDRPVFRGTADEIDVGRLRVGMAAQLRLAALPGLEFAGKVASIGLRAQRQNASARFDVLIELEQSRARAQLRAGFSAIAEIELARAEDVLVIPERVLKYDGDQAWLRVRSADGTPKRRELELGVADGLLVEIKAGLREGEDVLEPGRETR